MHPARSPDCRWYLSLQSPNWARGLTPAGQCWADDTGHHTPPPALHLAATWVPSTWGRPYAFTAETSKRPRPSSKAEQRVDQSPILARAVKMALVLGTSRCLSSSEWHPTSGTGLRGGPPVAFARGAPRTFQRSKAPSLPPPLARLPVHLGCQVGSKRRGRRSRRPPSVTSPHTLASLLSLTFHGDSFLLD